MFPVRVLVVLLLGCCWGGGRLVEAAPDDDCTPSWSNAGYHKDDKDNCVCNSGYAGATCSSNLDCCMGQVCKLNGRCSCILLTTIPVASSNSYSNCCNGGDYWPTFRASYCNSVAGPNPTPSYFSG